MANSKKTLHVGGLADDVNVNILKTAFLPFGDIADIIMPMDNSNKKHRGFAFIEFQLPEDAADAIDNMDNSEILGKTIKVNIARPMKFKSNRPIWADDDYLRKVEGDGGEHETTCAREGTLEETKDGEEDSDTSDSD